MDKFFLAVLAIMLTLLMLANIPVLDQPIIISYGPITLRKVVAFMSGVAVGGTIIMTLSWAFSKGEK